MLNVRFPKLRKPGIMRNEKGFTLIEVVISIVLLGLIAAALATGLSTAAKVLVQNDSRQTAKNLAESQMEWVKNQFFIPGTTDYSPAPIPSELIDYYTATITATDARDSALQKITVQIFKSGVLIYTLEGYKVE